jgi:peptide/nickel transport system substrate-binding protein
MLPGEIGYSDKDPHFSFDMDKCKAAFQASTLKAADGKSLWDTGFRFTAAYNTGNTSRQSVGQILQNDLGQVNPKFVVELTGLPWPTFLKAQRAKQLPLFISGWLEDIHDPHDWLVPYATGGGAYSARQSMPDALLKTFAPLINSGAVETDPAKRAAIYQQFNQAFYAAAPDILLAVPGGRHYEQRWVQGYFYNPIYTGYIYYNLSKQ